MNQPTIRSRSFDRSRRGGRNAAPDCCVFPRPQGLKSACRRRLSAAPRRAVSAGRSILAGAGLDALHAGARRGCCGHCAAWWRAADGASTRRCSRPPAPTTVVCRT